MKTEQINVDEINHLPDDQQAEIIAKKFTYIQNIYEPLKTEDISVPPFAESEIPQFNPTQVWFVLSRLDTNKARVPGDFPARLIKQFWSVSGRTFVRYLQHKYTEGGISTDLQV